ncbi:hypothetical protein [Streptococcus parasuis]|uniref:hypothetical protein n=1 Tax=Streptococcus parasuis TaxID=1501662 RepID=UPI0028B0C829|nr:hypothetical protein [Streptococcus parasuis]
MLALIISLVSISISIFSFLIPLYKSTFRLGVSNQKAQFNIDELEMIVEITFINESSSPITIEGLIITEKEFQFESSNYGELLKNYDIKTINLQNIKYGSVPFIIPPFSTYKNLFVFRFPNTTRSDYFLEVQTSKGFYIFPFNPSPHVTSNTYKKVHGRIREENTFWKQNYFRSKIKQLNKLIDRSIEYFKIDQS